MDTLITTAFIWLPGAFVFLSSNSFGSMHRWSLDWQPADQKWWDHLRNDLHHGQPAVPTFILKDEVEMPRLWCYSLMICVICALSPCSKRPSKSTLFWMLFTTMLVLRCLAVVAGTIHFDRGKWYQFWMLVPVGASSSTKGLLLHWVVNLSMWKRTFLGTYSDGPSSDDAGKPFYYNSTIRVEPPVPWRDVIVRLAYYHVIDNAIHVLLLRHGYEFGDGLPYTDYVNNSEILTVVLAVQMGAWSVMKMRARDRMGMGGEIRLEEGVVFEKDVEV
jgi:hypothetical protein